MPAPPTAASRSGRKKSTSLSKALAAKEKRHREEATKAMDTCVNPPFLHQFPVDTRDLVSAKLQLYHIRFGTKAFNMLSMVNLIHLVEHSAVDGIPFISQHAGWFP